MSGLFLDLQNLCKACGWWRLHAWFKPGFCVGQSLLQHVSHHSDNIVCLFKTADFVFPRGV